MSTLVDVIRRTLSGQTSVYASNVPMQEASRMLARREADTTWPVGLARTLTHVARLVLIYGPDVPKTDIVKSPGKQPIETSWPKITVTAKQAELHVVQTGGNLGMRCGSGLVVLDFDDPVAEKEMIEALGPIEPTVITGSGMRHYYFKGGDDLPAKIIWKGKKAGEIQRTNGQQVVCPPSVHPRTKQAYVWAGKPSELTALPAKWDHALRAATVPTAAAITNAPDIPDYIRTDDKRGHEADGSAWDGPTAEVILDAASKQPGARRRGGGWKFQCAGCAAEGHDKSRDNAVVRDDGRWGCALDPRHKFDIRKQLGIHIGLGEFPDTKLGEILSAPLGEMPEAELGEMPEAALWTGD